MLGRLSLNVKLASGFGVVLLILAGMGTASYLVIHKLGKLSAAADTKGHEAYLIRSIQAVINERGVQLRSFLLSGNNDHMSKYQESNRELAEDFAQLEPLLTTELGKKLFAQCRQAADAYDRSAQRVAHLKRAGNESAATALLLGAEMSQTHAEMENTVAAFAELCEKLKASAREEQARTESTAMILIPVLGITGLGIGLAVAGVIARGIARAAADMVAMIQGVAANDLAIEDMAITSEDEIGRAGIALNQMKNGLKDLIQSIARTAEHVASASEEISSSASQQVQGAETQKGQTTQVATAMQEMQAAVQEVSKNSNDAAQAASQAAETAREGGLKVEDSLVKMRAIADSVSASARKVEELGQHSNQIGRIIGVIDDIADQTNLLALNAAIEAARAGEQGRGFAVVADEVRKLAERTTSATKEVAQMVQNIQGGTKTAVAAMHEGTKQVEEGVLTTAKAGESLKQIIQMSERVGEMIAHIATASTEQSASTEQVNQNVEQIARLVNESATGAEQSAKACQDLSGLALDLQKMVFSFKLEQNPAGAAAKQVSCESKVLSTGRRAVRGKAFAAGAR